MHTALNILHRWLGLAIAGFLFVSGLTGAVISWDHELDEALNPHLTDVDSVGPAIPPLELAAKVEAEDPRARVSWITLAAEPGHALSLFVDPRRDATTGRLFELDYNQIFLDPVTGAENGRRYWGAAWPITTETFVSFLYVLHYSLHIPEFWGIDLWGMWLLGIVAMVWTVDCFIGFYLTLPTARPADPDRPAAIRRQLARGWWARWEPAWRIKTTGSLYRIAFDIHRAFGLWTWALLFLLAFTAFSLNLYGEIFYPVMSLVSEVTPSPFELREAADHDSPIEPLLGYAEIIARAEVEAVQRAGARQPGPPSTVRSMGSTGSASSSRETITGPPASGRPSSIMMAATAAIWARMSRGKARWPTCSCRRSSRCTAAASWACPAASWSRSWVLWSPPCPSPEW